MDLVDLLYVSKCFLLCWLSRRLGDGLVRWFEINQSVHPSPNSLQSPLYSNYNDRLLGYFDHQPSALLLPNRLDLLGSSASRSSALRFIAWSAPLLLNPSFCAWTPTSVVCFLVYYHAVYHQLQMVSLGTRHPRSRRPHRLHSPPLTEQVVCYRPLDTDQYPERMVSVRSSSTREVIRHTTCYNCHWWSGRSSWKKRPIPSVR